MDDEPRGLVDDEERVVLVHDMERHVFRDDRVSSSPGCGATRTTSPFHTGSRGPAARGPIVTWPSPIQRWMRLRE